MVAAALVIATLVLNTSGTVCFKLSVAPASGGRRWRFLAWQAVGNFAGFLGVLSFTGLLRHMSLAAAFPLVQGLTVIGVQLLVGRMLFAERISPMAWAGTGLLLGGIVLVSL
jgi:multidrug transporter EmrE-like cation transporter